MGLDSEVDFGTGFEIVAVSDFGSVAEVGC